jgi:hypothetical protein
MSTKFYLLTLKVIYKLSKKDTFNLTMKICELADLIHFGKHFLVTII